MLILGKKWPKIHFFPSKTTKATQLKVPKYETTDTFTLEMTYHHIFKSIFHL